jgi:hypothetical protein
VAHSCNPSYSGGSIRRIEVQSQPRQIVGETLFQKKKNHKKRAGRMAQGVDSEFKPQYQKRKSRNNFNVFFLNEELKHILHVKHLDQCCIAYNKC